jgi:hypothetical protein
MLHPDESHILLPFHSFTCFSCIYLQRFYFWLFRLLFCEVERFFFCSFARILRAFRYKAVAKDWRSDDTPGRRVIDGQIEFTQDSAYDATNVKVNLNSLLGIAGGYHVHEVPVELEKEFPCITTGGHWNPLQAVVPTVRIRDRMNNGQ